MKLIPICLCLSLNCLTMAAYAADDDFDMDICIQETVRDCQESVCIQASNSDCLEQCQKEAEEKCAELSKQSL
ncbi:hypothetical protein Lqui_0181 [Legionella quinlivanii]|uniref:Uncharacterized protein n=1 Tax=Legionella quinlivanii TaxID=45073 RepID=A0A0W0Y6F0_9GAMM|nr:hypothetical protein [Legionella quinlivanii]KTD52539.1 hypothetical protein Lqui_0181 [Legionella quinlivanii]SEG44121.1 hypothetical protein SAMN02746093_02959 [Legionella quinlivanii DSM 21216]STY09747.1 Uncharacterised protein [Legionella quinlivanii]